MLHSLKGNKPNLTGKKNTHLLKFISSCFNKHMAPRETVSLFSAAEAAKFLAEANPTSWVTLKVQGKQISFFPIGTLIRCYTPLPTKNIKHCHLYYSPLNSPLAGKQKKNMNKTGNKIKINCLAFSTISTFLCFLSLGFELHVPITCESKVQAVIALRS